MQDEVFGVFNTCSCFWRKRMSKWWNRTKYRLCFCWVVWAFILLLNLIETSIVIQQESLSSSSSSKYLIPVLAHSSLKYLIFIHCMKALKGICVCLISRKPQFSILLIAFKCFTNLDGIAVFDDSLDLYVRW